MSDTQQLQSSSPKKALGSPKKSLPSPKKRKLVGYENFVRHNPKTDLFEVKGFHHIEFYCQDATNISKRFQWGLGFNLVAKSDQSTGNHTYASYVVKSKRTTFTFTAPYAKNTVKPEHQVPQPSYDMDFAYDFTIKHGFAARAIGISVVDAADAYQKSVSHGAIGVLEPQTLVDKATNKSSVISEIKLYGDVVLRFVSGDYEGIYLPNYEKVDEPVRDIGIDRIDHCVGNVEKLMDTVNYLMDATGFHEFAEFTAEDVGTVDSGLNSMVLASNNEMVLLPINEPTHGTKRKSQIQMYLEQNEGEGLQHIALKTDDIFETMKEMRMRSVVGGFEFMPKPSAQYYQNLPNKIGDGITPKQYEQLEQLGLLADRDDQGILLQIFTKPLGDRPTIFIEIIQRIGCMDEIQGKLEQAAGCGGFGKGNFSELFKSIEEYEKTLKL